MLKNHLQPILNFLFANSTERKEGRSPQTSMLKNHQLVQQSHLQPVINYFNEQAPEKATASKISQRSKLSGSKLSNWLDGIWKAMITIDTDPQIKQRVDHMGQIYWHVYDPVVDRRFTFLAEDEVYQWLETRYYQ